MPALVPFVALGRGNGFNECLEATTKAALEAGTPTALVIDNLTLTQAMRVYWLAYSIQPVDWQYGTSGGSGTMASTTTLPQPADNPCARSMDVLSFELSQGNTYVAQPPSVAGTYVGEIAAGSWSVAPVNVVFTLVFRVYQDAAHAERFIVWIVGSGTAVDGGAFPDYQWDGSAWNQISGEVTNPVEIYPGTEHEVNLGFASIPFASTPLISGGPAVPFITSDIAVEYFA